MHVDPSRNGDHGTRAPAPEADGGVASAIDRAVDAAQSVVVDQIGLARLELERTLGALVRRVALSALGVTGVVASWVLFLAAAYHLLARTLSPLTSLGLLCVLNLVLGTAALARATERLRGATPTEASEARDAGH